MWRHVSTHSHKYTFLGSQNVYNSNQRSLTVVNILGSQKCALSLDNPRFCMLTVAQAEFLYVNRGTSTDSLY